MKTISQTKFLSENYSALHGLIAVPLGLCLFLTSLWANLVQTPVKNFFLPVVLLVGSVLLSLAVDRYYKNAYGEIKPNIARRRQYLLAQVICGVLGLAAFLVDVTYGLPVNFIGLLFASIFLLDKPAVAFPLNRFSAVRLITSICIILISISPLFLGRNWWDVFGIRNTILGVTMFVGLLIALQGVLWHVFFVSSLPAEEAQDE